MIVLIHGSDRLSAEERVTALRNDHDPSGLNTTVIDDASRHVTDVLAAVGAAGFFGSTRVVVARDLLTARAGRGGRTADAGGEALGMLGGVPASNVLIVVERAIDPATERAVRKEAPDLRVERFDVPRGRDLVEWTCARARRYDATIDAGVATLLLEALFPGSWNAAARRDDVPPDLHRLDSEIAKLATAAGEAGRIERPLVDSLVPGAESQNIWGLTDAIGAGDPTGAVREVERSLSQGVAPEMLLGQLAGQFEALAALAAVPGVGDLAAVASVTGLSEGRLRQSQRIARQFPAERVRASLSALRQFDADAKQGLIDPSEALVSLVARLASRAS
jgi:DNA polymerase-3 subunit delta